MSIKAGLIDIWHRLPKWQNLLFSIGATTILVYINFYLSTAWTTQIDFYSNVTIYTARIGLKEYICYAALFIGTATGISSIYKRLDLKLVSPETSQNIFTPAIFIAIYISLCVTTIRASKYLGGIYISLLSFLIIIVFMYMFIKITSLKWQDYIIYCAITVFSIGGSIANAEAISRTVQKINNKITHEKLTQSVSEIKRNLERAGTLAYYGTNQYQFKYTDEIKSLFDEIESRLKENRCKNCELWIIGSTDKTWNNRGKGELDEKHIDIGSKLNYNKYRKIEFIRHSNVELGYLRAHNFRHQLLKQNPAIKNYISRIAIFSEGDKYFNERLNPNLFYDVEGIRPILKKSNGSERMIRLLLYKPE